MLEHGIRISFGLSENEGGALVTKYRTFREDAELESTFKAYTKRHYNSWVTFAREAGHGDDIRPVLVTGVDMTRNFAMMAYSNIGDSLSNNRNRLPRSEFTTSVSALASVWGTWHTEELVHTNCGPQLCHPPSSTQTPDLTPPGNHETETVPDEYNQCVFVRYYTMRRKLLFPTIIRAAAGPHDLGPGHRDEELLPVDATHDSSSGSDTTSNLWDERDGEGSDFDSIADYIFQASPR